MGNLESMFEKPWKMWVAVVSVAFGFLVAFERDLADISLEFRFAIVGVGSVVAVILMARILALRHKSKTSLIGTIGRGLVIVGVSGLAMLMLMRIVTFHNIRILQKIDPHNSSIGSIEIQPSHRSTTMIVRLATSQGKTQILRQAPSNWNREDPVEWRMQNETPLGVTLTLLDFTSPKVFGVWYQLSGDARDLQIDASTDPPGVRILRNMQLDNYRKWIVIFGGVICGLGLLYWSHRSSWFRAKV